ncbi:MEDS domain-containing protein [Nocardioides piscis]|uniref:Uncharacterized protein n=1 Tax=Nocardioides piscis TaxID=2714938 RepID=A0A6G7YDP4_9ACTN|nr:MEDS domain-containing protein [Nocardioides piscis]QIK74758.1 hypothetical protein G7071_04270 [Nocardioides piscis]
MAERSCMLHSEHKVAAYDDVAALVERVADFVAESLADDVPVVTVCRPALRRAVDDRLVERGVDTVRASADAAFLALDAEETLRSFMVDGRPDPVRFARLVDDLVPADGRPVNAFGEMVAVLWERGEVIAALELEALWNSAIEAHSIRLLCAYPSTLLAGADLHDVSRMCDLHDEVSLLGAHPDSGEIRVDADTATSSVHLPVPAAVGSARRFVRDAVTTWGLADLAGDVALITSELATNAVKHGASPFRTTLVRADGGVLVAVEDGSSAWPELQDALPGDQDGRGMAIIATLSRRSGCQSTPGGKVAWAELRA